MHTSIVSKDAYFLGIDGGGTKTIFQLTDASGTLLNTIVKGPSNPNDIGMKETFTILNEGIHEVRGSIPCSQITLFAGLSGGGLTGDNARILHQYLAGFGFQSYDNGSDIDNLIALTGGKDCILVIMGTGCIVYAIQGTQRHRIAGWGQFFDEGGCGYTIGRDVITAALREIDTSGPKTLLTFLLHEQLGESAEAHLAKFYQGGKGYIASFTDLLWIALQQEDPVARSIIEKNMDFVTHMLNAAARHYPNADAIPVYCAGGISKKHELLFPLIRQSLDPRCQLLTLPDEPITGALLRALQLYKENSHVKN